METKLNSLLTGDCNSNFKKKVKNKIEFSFTWRFYFKFEEEKNLVISKVFFGEI
jgi:hypothetical protein